jgi:hypothetical protein
MASTLRRSRRQHSAHVRVRDDEIVALTDPTRISSAQPTGTAASSTTVILVDSDTDSDSDGHFSGTITPSMLKLLNLHHKMD